MANFVHTVRAENFKKLAWTLPLLGLILFYAIAPWVDAMAGPMVMADSNSRFNPSLPVLDRTGWYASASDYQSSSTLPKNIIDGDDTTIWHSNYSDSTKLPLPHWVKVNMRGVYTINSIEYVPRQDGTTQGQGINGQIGQYKVETSLDNSTYREVATGTLAYSTSPNDKPRQVIEFPAHPARYIKFTALSEGSNTGKQWSSIAELYPRGTADKFTAIPNYSWTASADSAQNNANGSKPASNAIDNNPATIWHTDYVPGGSVDPLPHNIDIDMKRDISIEAISYLPRQDGGVNGRIGQYQVQVKSSSGSWTTVASGTFDDNEYEQGVYFTPVTARYVRVKALSEAGNRGQWTAVAELSVYETGYDKGLKSAQLPREGWGAVASSSQNNYAGVNPPSNALDGNADTIWHTNYDTSGALPKHPHYFYLDFPAPTTVSGIQYLPRQDNNPSETSGVNGRIGKYEIAVRDYAAEPWVKVAEGTWEDSFALKTARFYPVTKRHVRILSKSDAGNRSDASSAAEFYALGDEDVPASKGSWGNLIGTPITPASAVMLPNNKVLVFSAYMNSRYNRTADAPTQFAIIDLATNTVSNPPAVNTHHQMFCTGISMLADGRILITGGSYDKGVTIYNPATNSWSQATTMSIGRAYHTSVTLSNGKVFVLGGSWNEPNATNGNTIDKKGEVYTPGSGGGSWQTLSNVSGDVINIDDITTGSQGSYRADNHAWLFAVGGGNVFHAGPSKAMHWITTSGSGSISNANAGLRSNSLDSINGTAVMYDINKIFTAGGATSYQDYISGALQANKSAHTIDLSAGFNQTPTVASAGDMTYRRTFMNGTVLPDGSVLITGGQQHPQPFTDTASATTPELWTPGSGFSLMNPETAPRNYHSAALLLNDGRVMTVGGGLCSDWWCETNHSNVQIFTPPYLLNSNGTLRSRPSITSAPTTATKGTNIAVSATSSTTKFSLIRMSSATHTVNSDQRRVPVTIASQSGTSYTLSLPGQDGVLIPGNYMLFALDSSGTPSVAKYIKVQ